MTKKQVWKYTCEFCGRSKYAAGHMANHEKYCTANPARECRMHKHLRDEPLKPVAELIAVLAGHKLDKDWVAAREELRKAADDCPACMLAAIRQSGLQKWCVDEDGIDTGADFQFDFKAEMASFWEAVNEARGER